MMEHIQQAKAVADDDFRQGKYNAAVVAYSRALDLSEQHQIADLLHLLYSNRCALDSRPPLTGCRLAATRCSFLYPDV
jgi:hypothetical protein